jgi:hypothetical protein
VHSTYLQVSMPTSALYVSIYVLPLSPGLSTSISNQASVSPPRSASFSVSASISAPFTLYLRSLCLYLRPAAFSAPLSFYLRPTLSQLLPLSQPRSISVSVSASISAPFIYLSPPSMSLSTPCRYPRAFLLLSPTKSLAQPLYLHNSHLRTVIKPRVQQSYVSLFLGLLRIFILFFV